MKQLISYFIFSRLDYCNALPVFHYTCSSFATGPERRRTSTSGIVEMSPHTLSTDEATTLAARRVQNPIQADTGDVNNPHTQLPRLPHRFCVGMQQ